MHLCQDFKGWFDPLILGFSISWTLGNIEATKLACPLTTYKLSYTVLWANGLNTRPQLTHRSTNSQCGYIWSKEVIKVK